MKPKKTVEQYRREYLIKLERRKEKLIRKNTKHAKESTAPKSLVIKREDIVSMIPAVLSFFVPLVLYIITSPRTITAYGDSASLISHAYFLDAAHPPGYPLFVILGHIFSKIPIGDIAFRLSIMSTLTASLTSLFLYHVFIKFKLPRSWSLLSTLIISFSYSIWLYAITPEVFVINNFLAVLILYLTLKFNETKSSGKEKKYLYLIAISIGLGLANHMTIVLLALPVIYFLIIEGAFTARSNILKFIICMAVGLSPYILVVKSSFDPSYPQYGNVQGLTRFVEYLTRYDYGGVLSGGVKTEIGSNESYFGMFFHYLKLLIRNLTVLSIPGILYFIGKKISGARSVERITAITAVLSGIIFPAFALSGLGESDLHSQGVAERFGLLGFLFLGISFAVGTFYLFENIYGGKKRVFGKIMLLGLLLFLIITNYKKADKRNYLLAKTYAGNILGQLNDGDAVFTTDDMTFSALYYFSRVEGVKNIRLINSGFLGNANYQKELKNYWPELISTDSPYEFDIARNIIGNTNKEGKSAYFVMFDDPYPYGFLGNPYFLEPQGLLMKADLENEIAEIAKHSSENYWINYDYTGLENAYYDAFSKLAKYNYAHRAGVNVNLYVNYGCLACALTELENASAVNSGVEYNENTLSKMITDIKKPVTVEEYLNLAKSRFLQGLPNTANLNRTEWDLRRAYELSPQNEEVAGGLGEIYEMMKIYSLAEKYYREADKINPDGGWDEAVERVQKERGRFRVGEYF